MTTPTPRTDALLKDERHNTVAETRYWLDQLKTLARQLERDLAARDAELAELRAGTPHAAMVNRFLAWALPKDFGPDCGISFDGRKDDEWNKNKTWPIGTNLFTADQALAMFRHCVPTVTQDSQFHPDWSMLEATRESLREHMAELAEWKRKAEEAASELQMRRTPLNAPGDEELIRQSGIQLRHCSCSGGSGDEPHADDCPLWLDVLAARQWWRDRHVVAWSCSRETKGGNRCAQWCGHQQYCTAHTRDNIEIAAIAAKGEA